MLIFGLHVHVFHHVHGPAVDYVGVALAAFASWVGLPGPGESVLVAAAVIAARHKLDITPVVLVAWVGATVGGITGWLIGLKAGRSVLTARGPLQAMRVNAVDKGEKVFRRMEVVAVMLTPSWVAGIERSRARVFVPTTLITALLLWAVPIGVAAYYAAPVVIDVVDDVGVIAWIALVVLVLAVVGGEIVRRRRRTSPRESADVERTRATP
jgi:membrane protein DedA with SNARE-associated domain